MSLPRNDPATELLALAKAGDVEAQGRLVERFTPILLAVAGRRLGGWGAINQTPDDLVQQAWLTFFEKLSEIEPADGAATPVIMAFLSRTLGFHYLNVVKSAPVKRREADPTSDAARRRFEELADSTSSIVAKVARSERVSTVRQAIGSLPLIDQEILQLRGLDRLPFVNVAASVGMTPNAAAKRYERALDKLRTVLPDSFFSDLYNLDVESGNDGT
jgi:RNA polymerase sigma factor (sigma-70 family)